LKKIFFLTLLLSASLNLFCQVAQIDSLRSIIAKPSNDTALVNAWIALDNIIYLSDPEQDEELNQKILRFSEQKLKTEKSKSLIAFYRAKQLISLNNLGIIHMYRSDNEEAKNFFNRAIELAKALNNKQKIAAVFNNFGIIYYREGNYSRSIEFYTKALSINEAAGDLKATAAALNNIGNIYKEIGDTAKALSTFQRSLIMGKQAGAKNWEAVSYSAIAEMLYDAGKIDSAELLFGESMRLNRTIRNTQGFASDLANLGKIYLQKGMLAEAKEKADSALVLFREMKDQRAEGLTLSILGAYYAKKGDLKNAIDFNKRALKMLMTIGQIQEAEKAADALYKIYKMRPDYKNALEYRELYDQLHDSLQNEKNTKAVLRQEFKYEYDKQTVLDSLKHVAELDKKDAELKVKRQVQISLFAGLALILVFSGFIFEQVQSDSSPECDHRKAETGSGTKTT
jgi:tetratricopeptide (TPR) repeat protein